MTVIFTAKTYTVIIYDFDGNRLNYQESDIFHHHALYYNIYVTFNSNIFSPEQQTNIGSRLNSKGKIHTYKL